MRLLAALLCLAPLTVSAQTYVRTDGTSRMTGPLTMTGAVIDLGDFTTTQRNALTPAVGMLLYNTTDGKLQCYQGSAWVDCVTSTLSAGAITGTLADNQVSDTLTCSILRGSGSVTDAVDLATGEVSGLMSLANLAPGTSAQVLMSSSAPVATWTTLSGDITVGATGVTAIGSGKVVLGMLATAPATRHLGGLVTDPAGSALVVGDGLAYLRVPAALNGWQLVTPIGMHASTVSSSGLPTVQLRNVTTGNDLLSTKVSLDASEKDSSTAATPAVVNASFKVVSTGDEIAIDVDVAGTGAKGLWIDLPFTP